MTAEEFVKGPAPETNSHEAFTRCRVHYGSDAAFAAFWQKLVTDMWTREPAYTLEQMGRIKSGIPALVLHGEKEPFFPVDGSKELADAIGGKLVVVPGAGRSSHMNNPEFVNAEIGMFLDGLKSVL